MSKLIVIVFLGLAFLGFASGAFVDEDILDVFDSGAEKVRVIIEKNNSANLGLMSEVESNIEKITGDEKKFTAYVSLKELRDLELNSNILKIRRDIPLKIFMQDVIGIIEANESWKLESEDINLTGSLQSVCILDTGIDNDHSAFTGRILAEKCFCSAGGPCCPDGTYEDDNATDDHGHGTHVAGIIGGSGDLNGVAKGVGLVIVKIMNSDGNGFSSNMEDAVQWCIDNADTYNISVISASLGDEGTKYTFSEQNDCDTRDSGILAGKIYNASVENISVLIASGNNGWNDGITWPSCISSAIPIGSANKYDYLTFNRNALVKLLGIGTSVNSTCMVGDTGYSNGYCIKSGTSMATPVVAGSIAILNQFLKSSGRSKTPLEIEEVLYNNGKNISELGNNYTRVNVYDALLSLDITSPDVLLVSPVDNHINSSVNQSFTCNATDWQLLNFTFKIWNSTGLYYNETKNLTGTFNETSFDLLDLPLGDYEWNCFVFDGAGNLGSASSNFSLSVGSIAVELNFPDNGSYTNINLTSFNCNATSNIIYDLENVTFNLWNSSGNLLNSSSTNISGIENSTNFNFTFLTEGVYHWGCTAYNNNSDMDDGVNFSVTYDISAPVISGISVNPDKTSAVITWNTNEDSNSSVWISAGSAANSSDYETSHSALVSGLSASTSYDYVVRSCDRASNCRVSGEGSFTTDEESSSGGGSSGGGSSGTSYKTYSPSSSELSFGYDKELSRGDKVYVNVGDEKHTVSPYTVSSKWIVFLVQSDPNYVNLSIGESKNLSFQSDGDFLEITLNSIKNGKADVTLRVVPREPLVLEKSEAYIESFESKSENVRNSHNWYFYIMIFVVILFCMFFIIFINRKKLKVKKVSRKRGKSKKIKA